MARDGRSDSNSVSFSGGGDRGPALGGVPRLSQEAGAVLSESGQQGGASGRGEHTVAHAAARGAANFCSPQFVGNST